MASEKIKKRNKLTLEEKQQQAAVKALFDEHDEIYDKKSYMPRVPELLKSLKY